VIEYYLQIRNAHIGLVLASGGLFALRGLLAFAGARHLARADAVRYLSWTIDTLLLTAALMLLVTLRINPFTTPWLGVKLLVLVLYIVLGTMALQHARSRTHQAVFYVAALASFGFMYTVARAHHPLGFLAGVLS
jgi:uncharacterized membrane protein SirB2